jgi:hypothetical protein
VPLAPDLGGREHASATAHVAEGSLPGAVGPAAADARDTGDGASGSPGLGRGLVAGLGGDGVGLALVAGDELVGELDDVGADRRAEDVRHRDAGGVRGHVPLEGLDGDQRARGGGHCGGGGEGVRVGRVWRRRGKGWGWWRKVRVYIGAWLQGLGFGADGGLWAVVLWQLGYVWYSDGLGLLEITQRGASSNGRKKKALRTHDMWFWASPI